MLTNEVKTTGESSDIKLDPEIQAFIDSLDEAGAAIDIERCEYDGPLTYRSTRDGRVVGSYNQELFVHSPTIGWISEAYVLPEKLNKLYLRVHRDMRILADYTPDLAALVKQKRLPIREALLLLAERRWQAIANDWEWKPRAAGHPFG